MLFSPTKKLRNCILLHSIPCRFSTVPILFTPTPKLVVKDFELVTLHSTVVLKKYPQQLKEKGEEELELEKNGSKKLIHEYLLYIIRTYKVEQLQDYQRIMHDFENRIMIVFRLLIQRYMTAACALNQIQKSIEVFTKYSPFLMTAEVTSIVQSCFYDLQRIGKEAEALKMIQLLPLKKHQLEMLLHTKELQVSEYRSLQQLMSEKYKQEENTGLESEEEFLQRISAAFDAAVERYIAIPDNPSLDIIQSVLYTLIFNSSSNISSILHNYFQKLKSLLPHQPFHTVLVDICRFLAIHIRFDECIHLFISFCDNNHISERFLLFGRLETVILSETNFKQLVLSLTPLIEKYENFNTTSLPKTILLIYHVVKNSMVRDYKLPKYLSQPRLIGDCIKSLGSTEESLEYAFVLWNHLLQQNDKYLKAHLEALLVSIVKQRRNFAKAISFYKTQMAPNWEQYEPLMNIPHWVLLLQASVAVMDREVFDLSLRMLGEKNWNPSAESIKLIEIQYNWISKVENPTLDQQGFLEEVRDMIQKVTMQDGSKLE